MAKAVVKTLLFSQLSWTQSIKLTVPCWNSK